MTDVKTNEKQSPHNIELLLPWHAAGTLNSRDAEDVDKALAQDEELARRFAMVRKEMTETIHLNEMLGAPSPRAMENLFKAIDKERKAVRSRAASGLGAWLRDRFTPRVLVFSASAAALIIVLQAGVIAKMVLADLGGGGGATFEKASAPSRPITMIVPSAAGASIDTIGRIVAERMRRPLGQPVIIENVSGADGRIGVDRVARAKPDGYTIDLGFTSSHVLNAALYSLPYDVMNDFVTIAPVATTPLVFYARNSMPAKDLTELIAWLKVNPSKASMGVIDSSIHVLSALFQKETGTQFDLVPYRGVAPAMQDLVDGQIDVLIASPDQLPLMRAGSIKAYAVTSGMRLMVAPDIPTFAEMGLPALSFTSWYGLFAPNGTPRDSIGKINAAAVDALADQAVQSRLVDLGYEVFPRERQTPEALGALVRADAAKWWPIIKELGIKAR